MKNLEATTSEKAAEEKVAENLFNGYELIFSSTEERPLFVNFDILNAEDND